MKNEALTQTPAQDPWEAAGPGQPVSARDPEATVDPREFYPPEQKQPVSAGGGVYGSPHTEIGHDTYIPKHGAHWGSGKVGEFPVLGSTGRGRHHIAP